ncbi:MAG TPA: hypothetical protein VK518_22220 [Puia sp.]|nr:hypothetical protein [Puia sp.]
MNHASELYRLYRKFHFFYLILLLLSFSLSSTAQSLDSSAYPVLWLRADKGQFTDSS